MDELVAGSAHNKDMPFAFLYVINPLSAMDRKPVQAKEGQRRVFMAEFACTLDCLFNPLFLFRNYPCTPGFRQRLHPPFNGDLFHAV